MRKIVLFMHISLDGIVAIPSGELNWVHVDEEIFEYVKNGTDNADTALYGRNTYEMMENYWPTAGEHSNASKHDIEHSKWYNKVSKIVISSTLQDSNLKHTRILNKNITNEINSIKKESGKNIIVFGSPRAAQTLIEKNLIDEYWLFINQIILGKGTHLFPSLENQIDLTLVNVKKFDSGVVNLHYIKVNN